MNEPKRHEDPPVDPIDPAPILDRHKVVLDFYEAVEKGDIFIVPVDNLEGLDELLKAIFGK